MKRTKKAVALVAFLFCAVVGGYTYHLGAVPQDPAIYISAAMPSINGAQIVTEGVRGASDDDPALDESFLLVGDAPQIAPPTDEVLEQEAATPETPAPLPEDTDAPATTDVPSATLAADSSVENPPVTAATTAGPKASAAPTVTIWASVGPEDTVSYGDTITYFGRVYGHEDTAYRLQWQHTDAEGEWLDMEGETSPTLHIVLSQENVQAHYRLKIIMG